MWRLQSTDILCLLLLVISLSFQFPSGFAPGQAMAAEVYVDRVSGNDTQCSSLQELQVASSGGGETGSGWQMSPPCLTIDRALGNVACSLACETEVPIFDAILWLSDGVHTLMGCVAIVRGGNITIEAENRRQATIRCQTFGNLETAVMDPLQVCKTRGLVFRGLNFEGCGPIAPNVFLNRANDVVFEDCTFR